MASMMPPGRMGGGPPDDLPPELLAMLAGGGGPPPGMMAGGPPPGMMAGPPPGMAEPMEEDLAEEEEDVSPGELLRRMLMDARSFLDVAGSEQDRLIMEKVTSLLQGALASEEKDRESALGMSPKLKAMARGAY